METLTLLILIGVAAIAGMLCTMMREQRRHNQATEIALEIIKEKTLGRLEARPQAKPGEAEGARG